jgi:hypothetical protein
MPNTKRTQRLRGCVIGRVSYALGLFERRSELRAWKHGWARREYGSTHLVVSCKSRRPRTIPGPPTVQVPAAVISSMRGAS